MHAANPNTNVFTSKRVDSNGDYQNETLEMDLGRPRKLSIKLLTSQLALENHCDELSSFFFGSVPHQNCHETVGKLQ